MRILLSALLLAFALPVRAQTLYWTETSFPSPYARSATSSGGSATALSLGAFTLPEGVAFDESHRKIYWVEAAWTGARVLRASPNWSNVEVLVSGQSALRGIAVDEAGGKIYWTSSNLVSGAKVRRANLDGTNVETILDLPSGSNPRGITVDHNGGRIYFGDVGLPAIWRANLDGSAAEPYISVAAYDVAVDPVAGLIYWTTHTQGNIARCPIGGGGATKLKTGLGFPTALELDRANAMLYWIDSSPPKLRRMTTTAVNPPVEDLAPALTSFGGLAFSPAPIVDVAPDPTIEFALGRATPSPASGSTRVEFALPAAAHVRLVAVDVRGRLVATLAEGDYPAGRHAATWDGRDTPAGVYFLRFTAPGIEKVQRVVLLP